MSFAHGIQKNGLALDSQLCFALYSASLAMGRLYRDLLAELDLTYPQYLVMLVLWERDQVRVSDIGERLLLDSATLTPLLKRLERAGLLRRVRSTEDERSVVVTLTDEGAALRERARDVPQKVGRASCLTGQQTDVLKESLWQLRERLLEVA
ncbi:MAG: MarR family transcriptional regulator [Gemmatimonadetes bacterium]|jgi:DNA-binding MarR family transcriptional regulator|nr:MarR family transcriptional regulator [Gemmatimonadota bacterium]